MIACSKIRLLHLVSFGRFRTWSRLIGKIFIILLLFLLISTIFTSCITQPTIPDMLLCFVRGGSFSRQNDSGSYPSTQVMVNLSSYFIGKYEVSQADYEAIMGTNPSWYKDNPKRPVERVSWFDSIEYCNRRSKREKLTPCYTYSTYGTNPDNWPSGWDSTSSNHHNVSCNWDADGYRLPTEMEWMYAAKGGISIYDYTYSGSNNIDDVAWHWDNSDIGDGQGRRTHNVGLKQANQLGIHDMSGNVYEWCWDIYGAYPSGNQSNPTGPIDGSFRVMRGGSIGVSSPNTSCQVFRRSSDYATRRSLHVGFRCVRNSN